MPDKEEEETGFGVHFGKSDLDRVGFFDDPRALLWGPPLVSKTRPKRGVAQMTSGSLKGGYFDGETKRIFTGECLPELSFGPRKKKKKKKIVGVLNPPGYTKWHSSPGDAYGCFDRHPKRFDPATRPEEKREKMPPNCMTSPNPFGGPGYANITLSPYPQYFGPDPYIKDLSPKALVKGELYKYTFMARPYFDANPYRPVDDVEIPEDVEPTKKKRKTFYLHFPRGPQAGKNNGCLSTFPPWISEPFDFEPKRKKKKFKLRPWHPGIVPTTRTKFTTSIIDKVTSFCCNETNFRTYTERVYKIH